MTTLPQTQPTRAARPPAAPLAVGGFPPPALAVTPQGPQMLPSDYVRVIRSNMWLLLAFTILALVVGWVINFYLNRNYPKFTATGYITLQPLTFLGGRNRSDLVVNRQDMGTDLRTQAQLLRTENLWAEVFKEENAIVIDGHVQKTVRETDWFKRLGPINAKIDLIENFRVGIVPETTLLKIDMTASSAEDAATIVEGIVGKHLLAQKDVIDGRFKDQTDLLQQLKTRYDNQLFDVSRRVKSLERSLIDQGGSRAGMLTLRETQVLELWVANTKATNAYNAARSQRDDIFRQISMGQKPRPVLDAAEQDGMIHEWRTRMEQLKIERNVLLLRYGPMSSFVIEYDKRIDELQKLIDQRTAKLQSETLDRLVDIVRSQADATEADLKQVSEALAKARSEMTGSAATQAELLTAKEDERVVRELSRQTNEELKDIQLLKDKGQARLDWKAHPQKPDFPTFPKLATTMSISVMIGLGLALTIAFLRELLDTTVRSPRDIIRVGNMAILGIIPDESDDPQAINSQLPLVIFEAPHSVTAEQFRQLRTRLQHMSSLDTTRSIMVTGPSPMDGKTTVACNLAAGLALNGRKILLVDSNFRRPEIHRIFNVGNEHGFSDVLNGSGNFDDLIRETSVPNLTVMPSGAKPMNAAELFDSQLLIDFIERALEEFDHVIFDSGPLLVLSESVAMAPRVDGVVTVIRAHADSRGLTTRMRDLLRQIKAEHLGVVLNAVRAKPGGYYMRNIRTYYEYQDAE